MFSNNKKTPVTLQSIIVKLLLALTINFFVCLSQRQKFEWRENRPLNGKK